MKDPDVTASPPVSARPSPLPRAGRRAFLLAIIAGVVYLLIAGGFRFQFKQTNYAHHVFMADALLHGQFHIRPEALAWKATIIRPAATQEIDAHLRQTGRVLDLADRELMIRNLIRRMVLHDWAVFEDRLYGYWGLLTPLVTMPFVAVFGFDVSDQLISALFGALNVGLLYWLLRRMDRIGLCLADEPCRVALTLLLAFGSSHFWMTCAGQVWFTIQIVTLTMLLLAMVAVTSKENRASRYLLGGIFFGLAILGRNIVILLWLFFVILIWSRCKAQATPGRTWRSFASRVIAFCIPVAAAVGLQGLYNHARFGDPLQTGLEIQIRSAGNPGLLTIYERHGMFSLHYLLHNANYYFVNWHFPSSNDGRLLYDEQGNSLFLLMPPMLYLFLAWRRRTLFTLALVAGVVPLLIALLLYFATGFAQFGPRYLLDAMPLLLMLVAGGMRGRLTHIGYALLILAITAHLFGTSRVCSTEFGRLGDWISEWTLALAAAAAIAAGIAIRCWNSNRLRETGKSCRAGL